MLGDTAVVVNPEDERYKELIGKFAVLPIVGRLIKIIGDSYVDPDYGTGAMKVTPAHDFNDYELGKRHGLEVINIFDAYARINENGPKEYRGLDRFEARKKILAELEEQDLLVKVEPHTHMVPHDEKSKQVILEPWLTDQWYCDAPTLAKPALEAVRTGKTEFVPKSWENTYYNWMEISSRGVSHASSGGDIRSRHGMALKAMSSLLKRKKRPRLKLRKNMQGVSD